MIKFQEVWKTYSKELFQPHHIAVRNLSFSLDKGKILGLIGANGAGKSTSIRMLMDFIRPDKGSILVDGYSPNNSTIREKIGYLPETATFPSNLTIIDLISFTGTTCGTTKKNIEEKSSELLRQLDLWEARKRPLRNFSKGMQQRANFAIALINDPELLILDEPMSGLDPVGRKKIIDLISQLKESGKTILFCSHILEDVDRLVDNVLLLHKGEKLFFGTPDELLLQEQTPTLSDAFVTRVKREENNV